MKKILRPSGIPRKYPTKLKRSERLVIIAEDTGITQGSVLIFRPREVRGKEEAKQVSFSAKEVRSAAKAVRVRGTRVRVFSKVRALVEVAGLAAVPITSGNARNRAVKVV